jgi:hypothetical protein
MLSRLSTPVLALLAVLLPQQVSFTPRFVPGDEFRLEIKHTREDSRQAAAGFTATTPVAVRVVSTGAAGTVLDWTPGNVQVTGSLAEQPDPATDLASEVIGDVTIRIALDPDGSFGRVENSKELLSKLTAVLDVAIAELERGKAVEESRKMRELMGQILTPQNLLNMATRDIQTYVAMHGVELPSNKALDVPIRQANPFGGDPLSAVLRLRVESSTADTATLVSSTVYDTDALKKSTLALLERAAPPGKKPTDEELASFRLELSDEGRYVFDTKLGLFRTVSVTRRTGTSAGSVKAARTDRYDIRLVTPPKR